MAVAGARVSRVASSESLRVALVRGAHLLAASGFALAQPLFDLLGKNPEFFAVRGSTPGDIVLFALVVTFAPALLLLAVERTVSALSPSAGSVLHHVFLGFLGAVFGIQALKRAGLSGTTSLIAGAVLIGAAVALAAWRLRAARSFLSLLAAAPVLFLALFLVDTPVEKLVFDSGGAQAAAIRTRTTTPVVFLLFDEFPVIDLQNAAGAINAARFPNFARLAASSTWFRNTTTLSASTTVAVPMVLTGQKPFKGALPTYHDHPNNLFTLLGSHYRLKATESQTRLCPHRLCKRKAGSSGSRLSSLYSDVRVVYLHLLAPPALEDELPVIDESWGDFGSGPTAGKVAPGGGGRLPKVDLNTFYLSRVRDFNRFVASFRPPGKGPPTLYFLHVLLPHAPWLYFPDGKVRAVAKTNAPGRTGERWFDEQLAEQAWQRHLLQLGYTDRLLGEFLRRLHRTGLWDKALVIVTADHGIGFRGDDLRRRPTRRNLAELAFVPLFVKLPRERQGRVDDRHVLTLDILPTIADVLGIKIPWKTDGSSALAGGTGSSRVDVAGVREPYGSALVQRRSSLARQLNILGGGSWGPRLSGTGRYRGLVGRPLGALRIAGSVSASVTIDSVGSKLLSAFPKRPQLVPSPLTGPVSGLHPGDPIAVALNGRIAAVSAVYRGARFSALVPESAFRPGRNRVRAFAVSGSPSTPELRELRVRLST
jgi:Sulfatase